MSELPITKGEYDKSVILVDFLSEFNSKIKDNQNIENIVFIPQINGYRINFVYSDVPCVILLSLVKNLFSVKMTVEYAYGSEKTKKFTSKNENNNKEIIAQLLDEHN